MKKFWLILFYGFANHLPNSYTMLVGKICNRIRISICRHIFKECGKVSTINRNIYFGKGQDIVIGDYSGIGANCVVNSAFVGLETDGINMTAQVLANFAMGGNVSILQGIIDLF